MVDAPMVDAPTAMRHDYEKKGRQQHNVVKILGLVDLPDSTCNSNDDAFGRESGWAGAFGI